LIYNEADPKILEILRSIRRKVDAKMAEPPGMSWEAILAAEGAPDHIKTLMARWREGLDAIKAGDYLKGWALWETRKDIFPLHEEALGLDPRDRWDGLPFDGTLFVNSEGWGYGDVIQFARYLPMARARCSRLIFLCESTLCPVLDTLGCMDGDTCDTLAFVPGRSLLQPPFDFHVSLLSLPYLFGTTLETIPGPVPYLSVPDEVPGRADLNRLIDGAPGRKIGLTCAGSRRHPNDKMRSATPEVFGALQAIPDATLFSFQWGSWEYPTIPGAVPLGEHLYSFASTAHALSKMDLVIGVDSSLIHLAGALGRPVWTVLPFDAEFRWMEGRSDTPWYPTMRLFRQPSPGDWGAVMREVIQAA
jgi:hypothetical protein